MKPLSYLWALPNSAVGALLGGIGILAGGSASIVDGVVEFRGALIEKALKHLVPIPGGADAITFGHVILGRNDSALRRCRSHEHVHVRQYERWGPFFLPAYVAASAIAFARGGDAYRDNHFEREAYGDSCQ